MKKMKNIIYMYNMHNIHNMPIRKLAKYAKYAKYLPIRKICQYAGKKKLISCLSIATWVCVVSSWHCIYNNWCKLNLEMCSSGASAMKRTGCRHILPILCHSCDRMLFWIWSTQTQFTCMLDCLVCILRRKQDNLNSDCCATTKHVHNGSTAPSMTTHAR